MRVGVHYYMYYVVIHYTLQMNKYAWFACLNMFAMFLQNEQILSRSDPSILVVAESKKTAQCYPESKQADKSFRQGFPVSKVNHV